MRAGPDHAGAYPGIPAPTAMPAVPARPRRRLPLSVLLMVAALIAIQAAPASASPTQAERVVHAVESHLGARYVHGSTGPRTFDCSGLVFRSFQEAGLAKRIGGFSSALGYYLRFRRMGRMSRVGPRVGDLVVYANGGHIGIYVGRGKVVSALLSGVKRHPIRGLNVPFTGILRVHLYRGSGTGVVPLSTSPKKRQVVVAGRRLPLRSAPRRSSASLDRVRRGTRMMVFGRRTRSGTTWLKVRVHGGERGWVNQGMTSPR